MDEAWVEAHNAFHAALLSGCRNQRLLSIALSVRDASGLYKRWTRSVGQDKVAIRRPSIVRCSMPRWFAMRTVPSRC